MTTVIYPLSYTLEDNTKYWYFSSPSAKFNQSAVSSLIQKYHVYVETKIQLSSSERIIMDLKVHKKTGKHLQPIQYRIVYIDELDSTVIRADGDHSYPHIDIELPNKEKVTNVFDTYPYDYETGINTVLRYVEFYKNWKAGIDYWLFNLLEFRRELLYSYFKSNKKFLQPLSSFTDIARLVSIDHTVRQGELFFSDEDIARLITRNFLRCKIHEEKYNRPLKVSRNLIPQENNTIILPFPIIAVSKIPSITKVYDIQGKKLPNVKVDIIGKTTELRKLN